DRGDEGRKSGESSGGGGATRQPAIPGAARHAQFEARGQTERDRRSPQPQPGRSRDRVGFAKRRGDYWRNRRRTEPGAGRGRHRSDGFSARRGRDQRDRDVCSKSRLTRIIVFFTRCAWMSVKYWSWLLEWKKEIVC